MKRVLYFLSFLLIVLFANAQILKAQCGASLSSCKTCHEVKHEKSVANQGPWHQQHAFGDFCEFCHGGNTAAKDEASAHQGINKMPLKNAGNTCSSCHPDDYKERALKYAAVLKIDLGDLSAAEPANLSTQKDSTTAPAKEASTVKPAVIVSAPAGGEVVDFNKILNEKEKSTLNIGNLVLVALILGTLLLFFLLYVTFNKKRIVEKIKSLQVYIAKEKEPEEHIEQQPDLDEIVNILQRRPLLQNIVLQLNKMDRASLESLLKIIGEEGEGERLLKSLSHLDLHLVSSLNKLNDQELEVTTTLAKRF